MSIKQKSTICGKDNSLDHEIATDFVMISRCLWELNASSIGSSLICVAEMQIVPISFSLRL